MKDRRNRVLAAIDAYGTDGVPTHMSTLRSLIADAIDAALDYETEAATMTATAAAGPGRHRVSLVTDPIGHSPHRIICVDHGLTVDVDRDGRILSIESTDGPIGESELLTVLLAVRWKD